MGSPLWSGSRFGAWFSVCAPSVDMPVMICVFDAPGLPRQLSLKRIV
jgi:hypothetical protein